MQILLHIGFGLVDEQSEPPAGVTARRLDLDHFGAEIGQHAPAQPTPLEGEIQYPVRR